MMLREKSFLTLARGVISGTQFGTQKCAERAVEAVDAVDTVDTVRSLLTNFVSVAINRGRMA